MNYIIYVYISQGINFQKWSPGFEKIKNLIKSQEYRIRVRWLVCLWLFGDESTCRLLVSALDWLRTKTLWIFYYKWPIIINSHASGCSLRRPRNEKFFAHFAKFFNKLIQGHSWSKFQKMSEFRPYIDKSELRSSPIPLASAHNIQSRQRGGKKHNLYTYFNSSNLLLANIDKK